MTSGSYTIGGTSPDYATISAFDAAISGDLTGVVEGKLRAVDFNESNVIDAGGYTTTASNYVRLTYDTGAFHGGDLWSGAQIHGVDPNSTNAMLLELQADYTRVIGLNFNRWHGSSVEGIRVNGATNCRIEQCLFWGSMGNNHDGIFWINSSTSANLYVSNCLFAFLGRTAIHVQGDQSGNIFVYNVTAVYCAATAQSSGLTDGSPAIGDDQNDPPVTNGINWQIKNTYAHSLPDPQSLAVYAFAKGAASSWVSCNNNASSDSSAPGTSAQTSVDPASQFLTGFQYDDCGENAGSEVSAATEDSWINGGATTTNYGSSTTFQIDDSPVQNFLLRINLSNVTNTARIIGAGILLKLNASPANMLVTMYRLLRAWTEGGVTYNKYDGTNDWTTAGATGEGTDVEANGCDGAAANKSWNVETSLSAGDWLRGSGGKFVEWVQDAIDGNAPGSNADAVEFITRFVAGAGTNTFRSVDYGTDGNYPEIFIYYDTAAAPFDPEPISTGVLDANGANLSSDTDYPISIDVEGRPRSTWDIGAWAMKLDGEVSETASANIALPGEVSETASANVALQGEQSKTASANLDPKNLIGPYDGSFEVAPTGNGDGGPNAIPWGLGADHGTYHTVSRESAWTEPDGFWAGRVDVDALGGDTTGFHHYGSWKSRYDSALPAPTTGALRFRGKVLGKTGMGGDAGARIIRYAGGMARYDGWGGNPDDDQTALVTADDTFKDFEIILPPWYRLNQFDWSEDFDNAAWTKANVIVTPNTYNPSNFVGAADTVTDAETVDIAYIKQAYTVPDDTRWRVGSLFVRKNSRTYACSLECGHQGAGTEQFATLAFRPDTGAIVSDSTAAYGGTGGVIDFDANFWRVWVAVPNNNTGNTSFGMAFFPAGFTQGGSSDATLTGYQEIIGGMAAEGSGPQDYQPMATEGVGYTGFQVRYGAKGTVAVGDYVGADAFSVEQLSAGYVQAAASINIALVSEVAESASVNVALQGEVQAGSFSLQSGIAYSRDIAGQAGTSGPDWYVRSGTSVVLTGGQLDPLGGSTASKIENINVIFVDDLWTSDGGYNNGVRLDPGFFLWPITKTGTLRCIDSQGAGNSDGLWEIDLSKLPNAWSWIHRNHPAVTITAEFLSQDGTGPAPGYGGVHFHAQSGGPLDFYLWGVMLYEGTIAYEERLTQGSNLSENAGASVQIETPQFAVPVATDTIGGWTDDGGGTTNIHENIDELFPNTAPDDTDYIRSPLQ